MTGVRHPATVERSVRQLDNTGRRHHGLHVHVHDSDDDLDTGCVAARVWIPAAIGRDSVIGEDAVRRRRAISGARCSLRLS